MSLLSKNANMTLGKFIFRYCMCTMLILFGMTSCSWYEEEDNRYDRTVLVYMAADNSLSSYTWDDIDEMVLAAGDIPKNSCLYIYVDDKHNMPRILSIEQQEEGNTYKTIHQYTEEHNSGDPETLGLVMEWIINNSPSESYGLVLWSHGTSWMPTKSGVQRAICQDTQNDSNSWMNIDELSHTLKGFPKLEFIFFDACFMQAIEVSYELRQAAHYLLGSPAEIPGPGAPYDRIIKSLFSTPFDANEVIYQYYEHYSTYPEGYGVVLSAVDCSYIEDLLRINSEMITKYIHAENEEMDLSNIQKYVLKHNDKKNSIHFRPAYHDMNAYMKNILSENDYIRWKAVFDKTVPYRYTTSHWLSKLEYGERRLSVDIANYGGLSCFIPSSIYPNLNEAFRATSWYKASGWQQTGW